MNPKYIFLTCRNLQFHSEMAMLRACAFGALTSLEVGLGAPTSPWHQVFSVQKLEDVHRRAAARCLGEHINYGQLVSPDERAFANQAEYGDSIIPVLESIFPIFDGGNTATLELEVRHRVFHSD